jgi:hypothetical protein
MSYKTLDGTAYSNLKKVPLDSVAEVHNGKFANIDQIYSNLPNLKTLSILDRQHKKTPISDIYKLPQGITKLYLSAVGFKDMSTIYEHLIWLESLELSYILQPLNDNCRYLLNLNHLYLGNLRVPELVEGLSVCAGLESIILSSIEGSVNLAPAFNNGGLANLKELHINMNGGTLKGKCELRYPKDISHCKGLESLIIYTNGRVACYLPEKFDDVNLKTYSNGQGHSGIYFKKNIDFLKQLSHMDNLESLQIAGRVDMPLCVNINKLHKLTVLSLCECDIVSKSIETCGTNITLVEPDFANTPLLQQIALEGHCAAQLGGEIPASLGQCKELTVITMKYLGYIKIPYEIAKLPVLSTIYLKYIGLITEMPAPSEWVNRDNNSDIKTYIYANPFDHYTTGFGIPKVYETHVCKDCICKNPQIYGFFAKRFGSAVRASALSLCKCSDSEFGIRDPETGTPFVMRAELNNDNKDPILTVDEFNSKYKKLIDYLAEHNVEV